MLYCVLVLAVAIVVVRAEEVIVLLIPMLTTVVMVMVMVMVQAAVVAILVAEIGVLLIGIGDTAVTIYLLRRPPSPVTTAAPMVGEPAKLLALVVVVIREQEVREGEPLVMAVAVMVVLEPEFLVAVVPEMSTITLLPTAAVTLPPISASPPLHPPPTAVSTDARRHHVTLGKQGYHQAPPHIRGGALARPRQ